jgi:hypothetical protein
LQRSATRQRAMRTASKVPLRPVLVRVLA